MWPGGDSPNSIKITMIIKIVPSISLLLPKAIYDTVSLSAKFHYLGRFFSFLGGNPLPP